MGPAESARWLLAACAALGGCGACEPDRIAPQDAAPDSTAAASVLPSPAASIPPMVPSQGSRSRAGMHATCRAIAVEGSPRFESEIALPDASSPIAVQDRIVGDTWITLDAKGHLVVRDPRTARETTVQGPGRARLCVDAQEEAWIAGDGVSFESSPGSGETPGSEEWVVTELGVIRYAAARLVVQGRPGGVTLAVAEGAAFVWLAQDASFSAVPMPAPGVAPPGAPDASAPADDEGWHRVSGGTRATLSSRTRARRDTASARTASGQCVQLAGRAHDLAVALLGQPTHAQPTSEDAASTGAARLGAGLGAVADPAAQVRARRLARAACAVANLRAAQSVSDDTTGALQTLRQADSAWRELPAEGDPRLAPNAHGSSGE